jgi:hypothetical protein
MVYAHQKTSRPAVHIQKEYEKYKDKLSKPIVEEAKQYHSIRNICSLINIFLHKYSELHSKIDMFILHTYTQVKKEFGKESRQLFELLKTIHGDESNIYESLKTIEVESESYMNDKNMMPDDE